MNIYKQDIQFNTKMTLTDELKKEIKEDLIKRIKNKIENYDCMILSKFNVIE